MTSSPIKNSLPATLPASLRPSSPFPQLMRSAAASSSSSLSSLLHFASAEDDQDSLMSASTDIRQHQSLIAQAFGPTIAVVSSRECDDLVRKKGCTNLLDLLRPFGDTVQGRVNIRDSQAMSIPVDDFNVKFTDFHYYAQQSIPNGQDKASADKGPYSPKSPSRIYFPGGDLLAVEKLLEQRISKTEAHAPREKNKYGYFLRKLLSSMPISAHESFAHPVACILAVSARNPEPIDALLGLYNTTNNAPIPKFLDAGFLRYYVLVHDDDHDDIKKSNAILEKMKRSLGLHCNILRISTKVEETDTPLAKSAWISAGEELNDLENPCQRPMISASDQENLQKFTRDLVTQSVVPHMERSITTWNDQIASYRRGLAGRVFTASRRLFGTSSRSSTPNSGTGNYDPSTSSYPPSSPESQMRRLADYAFMLRDYKLSHSTYDIVRKDFANDKAWKYVAGAQEMTILALLLSSLPLTSSKRAEVVDPLLDSAVYSYSAPLSSPYYTLRIILISIELLCLRGGTTPDDAVKWAARALGTGHLGDTMHSLLVERIATSYKLMHPRRRRKVALWSMIACESWIGMGYQDLALGCLRDARGVYKDCRGFVRIHRHMARLMESLGVQGETGEKAGAEVVDMQHEGSSENITVEFA